MRIGDTVRPIARSATSVLRPLVSRVVPADGLPAEMQAPQLAADLVPQVYRPRLARLMSAAV